MLKNGSVGVVDASSHPGPSESDPRVCTMKIPSSGLTAVGIFLHVLKGIYCSRNSYMYMYMYMYM